ncbi:cytochrome b/b6 domain-containing protein [Azospirillum sp. sgz301742]
MPYDSVTRLLHATIASGVTIQMLVCLVMVYPRPNRLPNALWEVHEIVGLILAVALALHWAWSLGRAALGGRPILLFPWFAASRLRALRDDLFTMGGELRNGRIPHADEPRPAAAAFQGLGLVVASVLALTGMVMYFGMAENGAMGPVVHALKEVHEAAGPLMWAYLAVHPTIGILHQLAGHRTLSRMFRLL